MAIPASELFGRFLDDIAFRLYLPKTSRRILKKFSDIDVKVSDIVEALEENAYLKHYFTRYVAALTKEEGPIQLESAILRFGMQNTRNLLCALQLMRHVKSSHPVLDAAGKPSIQPKDTLRFAIQVEELLSGKKEAYPDTAFAAGVVFDVLRAVAVESMSSPKSVVEFIENSFKHGLRTARLGYEISRTLPAFESSKYVFAACLLHDAGKCALAVLDPAYVDFVELCLEKGLKRPLRQLIEKRRYGYSHEVYSFLCAHYFPIFDVVKEAILFHHEPQLLATRNREQYNLASLICLATKMAEDFSAPASVGDPALEKWLGPELRAFPVKKTVLVTVAGKISKSL